MARSCTCVENVVHFRVAEGLQHTLVEDTMRVAHEADHRGLRIILGSVLLIRPVHGAQATPWPSRCLSESTRAAASSRRSPPSFGVRGYLYGLDEEMRPLECWRNLIGIYRYYLGTTGSHRDFYLLLQLNC